MKMSIVEVVPISSQTGWETLSYFSSKKVVLGDLVSIPVRKKILVGVVIRVDLAKDFKTDIKKSSFGFKKIISVLGPSPLKREFLDAVIKTKKYFTGNTGQILNFFLPTQILEKYTSLALPLKKKTRSKYQFLVLQKTFKERVAFYKKFIAQKIKNEKSVFLILPTIKEVELWSELFRSDLNNVFTFSGAEKKIENIYNNILNSRAPVIIVSTPSGLFIPRHDIDAIILEHESSFGYRTIKRPYFDIRIFCKYLAENLKIEALFADEFLTIETLAKIKHSKNVDFDLSAQGPTLHTIDMTKKENLYKKSYILSDESTKIIAKTNKVFVFTLRKGLASQVICHDCRHVLKDGDTPLVLFEKEGKRILKNAFTNRTVENLRCENCGSWNFDNLGIGTETVMAELKKIFPKKKIFLIDGENTKTEKSVKKILSDFQNSKSAVLVGTQIVLPYLSKEIGKTIVVSMETLLHVPSYKSYEHMLQILLKIKQITSEALLIQTRTPENPVLKSLVGKNLKLFFKEETKRRETYSYPPFTTVLKLSRTSAKDDFENIKIVIEKTFGLWHPSIRRFRRGRNFETVIVAKLPLEIWNPDYQDLKLSNFLFSLNPDWQIRINPENLF